MNLYFWCGLDIGGEYADAWIGVISPTKERALEILESQTEEPQNRYYGECYGSFPDILPLRGEQTERIWNWGW
jgi:hypothetical protein